MTTQELGNYCEDYGKIMYFSLYMYVYVHIHTHVFHTYMYTHMYFYILDTIHCQICDLQIFSPSLGCPFILSTVYVYFKWTDYFLSRFRFPEKLSRKGKYIFSSYIVSPLPSSFLHY